MREVFLIIAPLFFIIFGAAFLRYINFIKEDWSENLNQFVLKIGLPLLIFTSLAKTTFSLSTELRLILINFAFIIFILILSYGIGHIFRLTQELRDTVIICLMFSNVAYLGIPLLTSVFDNTILPQLSLIVAVYLFGLFGIGVGYLEFTRRTSTTSIVKTIVKILCTNPMLIAVFCGIFISILHLPIPTILNTAFTMLVASVTPIVLIIIGVFIGQSTRGNLRDWYPVALFSFASLMILPALFYFGLLFFRMTPSEHVLSILESAMPLGVTPFALADQYKLDKNFIARSIVLSTSFSILTLPFWISFIT
jgi:hypothetical protein